MLSRAVGEAREAARRAQCLCNLCQIKLAFHNYHSQYGSFPPAYVADANGRPMHSWRVLILPFMEQTVPLQPVRFHRALGRTEQHQAAQQHAQHLRLSEPVLDTRRT